MWTEKGDRRKKNYEDSWESQGKWDYGLGFEVVRLKTDRKVVFFK